MATADQYAAWIVANEDKKGSPEFETVSEAYKLARAESQSTAPQPASRASTIPDVPPQPVAQPVSLMDRVKGTGEAGLSLVTGMTGGALGMLGGALGGAAGAIATGNVRTPEGARMMKDAVREGAERFTYQPRSESGQEQLAAIAGPLSNLAAVPPAQAISLASLAGPAAAQTRMAAAPVVRAISESPEADLVRRGAAATGRALTPTVNPETARLASKAQALNIPIRPDMLTDNRFARMMGEAFEKVPLSGSKEEARQIAFNRAVGAQIGADRNANRITPDVFDVAMTQSGEKIGEIAAKTPIPLDPDFRGLLAQTQIRSNRFEVSDVAKIVNSYISEIREKAAPTGVVPGETFRKITSDIGRQMRTTSNGDLKNALSNLQDDLHDVLTRNIANADDSAALEVARRQYAIGKTIEPLVAKATTGDLSPAGLMGAVTATKDKKTMMARNRGGELGDIARIGQLFLKEPRSSGTAERALTYGLLGGGVTIEPTLATGALTGANIYNRAGPAVTRRILAHQPDPELTGLAQLLRR